MSQNDVMERVEAPQKTNNNNNLNDHNASLQNHFDQNRVVMFFGSGAYRATRKPRSEYSLNGAL